MLKLIEKHGPTISILLLLALLACLLFWPGVSRPLGLGVLVLSLGMAILFTVLKHVRAWRKGQLERSAMLRNIVVDVLGSLMTIVAAILVAGKVAQAVGTVAGIVVESQWPGVGLLAGMLLGLLAGMAIGMGIGLLVQSTWGRLVKRPRAEAVENGI